MTERRNGRFFLLYSTEFRNLGAIT